MTLLKKCRAPRYGLGALLLALLLMTAACTANNNDGGSDSASDAQDMSSSDMSDGGMDSMDNGSMDMEGMDHDHADGDHANRVPNNGAVIQIISPADGSTFANGEEIKVEVQVENFSLGENGNHWHVYIDGEPRNMVMGNDTDDIIRGLDPGEHELGVFLANGDHFDLEEGDSIHVTVQE
ncbi:MAG: hypothetical protein ACE5E7_14695 [Anaerolineae bacterium]